VMTNMPHKNSTLSIGFYQRIPLAIVDEIDKWKYVLHEKLVPWISQNIEGLVNQNLSNKNPVNLRQEAKTKVQLPESIFKSVFILLTFKWLKHGILRHLNNFTRNAINGADYALDWFFSLNSNMNYTKEEGELIQKIHDAKKDTVDELIEEFRKKCSNLTFSRLKDVIDQFDEQIQKIVESPDSFKGLLTDIEGRLSLVFRVPRRCDIMVPDWVEKSAILILPFFQVCTGFGGTFLANITQFIKPESCQQAINADNYALEWYIPFKSDVQFNIEAKELIERIQNLKASYIDDSTDELKTATSVNEEFDKVACYNTKGQMEKLVHELANYLKKELESCENLLGFLTDDQDRLSFAFKVKRRDDIKIPENVEEEAVLIICMNVFPMGNENSGTYLRFSTCYIKPMNWWENLEEQGEVVVTLEDFIKKLKISQKSGDNAVLKQNDCWRKL
ncbi:hypothetical protein FO519_009256, partial [Halicephalobus sp. NKZ332]